MYKAEIIADSLSPQGNRLTTMKITFPRFILAELNTHRMFSRNSASSRAIPFKKIVKMVEENPFIPIAWQKDHKGMQGTEYWTDNDTVTVDEGDEYQVDTKIYSATEHFITEWLEARDLAISQAYELNRLGVTKQLCNRLLEPFMWHTVIVTATEWENFFNLRCPQYHTPVSGEGFYFKSKKDCIANHSAPENLSKLENMTDLEWLEINTSQADIHIQAIAELMWDAYNESKPKQLKAGDFHLPYGDKIDIEDIHPSKFIALGEKQHVDPEEYTKHIKVMIATARCARISYETLGDSPKIDYEADIKLHDRLLKSEHWSPFEHCARAMTEEEYNGFYKGFTDIHTTEEDDLKQMGWCRNFKGFIQYRHLIETK